MPRFEIEVHRPWIQVGTVVVEADSLVEAKDFAEEVAAEDVGDVEWEAPNVDPNRRIRAEWGRVLQ